MRRPILIHPDSRLKKVCDPVPAVDDDTRRLVDDMFETMYDAPGIGLAAPQIGVLSRVIVMDCAPKTAPEGEPEPDPQPIALINPEVVWASEAESEHEEGCLSIPEIYANVTRPEEVHIRFLTPDGDETTREFDGIWATCIQHEIDHLNGKLFIDYLSSMRRTMITQKMKKLKRTRQTA
ncbi:MAG: peptide deformylase [Pseudomonadota bacterium]